MRGLSILTPGLLTTLQDAGRPGVAHLGIGRSGAADLPAMRLANALAGNTPGACALEMTLVGPTLEFPWAARVALTGAPLPAATANGAPVPMWRMVAIPADTILRTGAMAHGCRAYLAVAGGIDVPPWLNSRCTDVNAALGPMPRPLAGGDVLPLGRGRTTARDAHAWSVDPRPWLDTAPVRTIRLLRASHTAMLDPGSLYGLTAREFSVRPDSNRVGVRLAGPRLRLHTPVELISEGLVPGVVQLPPDGQPIIMGWEHPVTGGYPRIGQVAGVDLPRLAQCRPGDVLRFEWIRPERARALLEHRDLALRDLVARIEKRLEVS